MKDQARRAADENNKWCLKTGSNEDKKHCQWTQNFLDIVMAVFHYRRQYAVEALHISESKIKRHHPK
jgi:hypothetical protein